MGNFMVQFCSHCIMPNTRPRVIFDEHGVCNACRNAEEKTRIDWDDRRRQFTEYVDRYRGKSGPYDCIVPWSGGKDSSYIAHRLKFEFGLNPLLVTFSPLLPNEVAVHNREAMLRLGFDHLMIRPNQKVARDLARRFFVERGNPKVAWDAGINTVPLQVAVNYKIPLVFYAEHGESEYGGRVLNEESKKVRDFTEFLEHQVGDDPNNWIDDSIESHDLAPYIYPDLNSVDKLQVKALYFSYFFRWSMLDNYRYIQKHVLDFRTDPKGRTDGTFTNFDSLDDKIDNIYYYLQYVKFGFGRATRDSCRMIQNGQMDRPTALEYARNFDDEFPATNFAENLGYLGLSEAEFTKIVDCHRNKELWTFEGNQWKLKFPPE